MPTITFKPSGKTIEVASGAELLDAAKSVDVAVSSPCGGKGTCGKCIVRIVEGDVDSDSLGVLSQETVSQRYVLACKTKVLSGDVVVEVPEQDGRAGGKFTHASDDASLVRRELFPTKYQFDPLAIKWCVDVPGAELEDGLSDYDRFIRRIRADWGKVEIICDLPILRILADVLRAENGKVTTTILRGPGTYHVINIEPGDSSVRNFGIAVDVGTTTVAVQLVYLPTGEAIASRADYNDQVVCGLDVISRINYARRPDRLEELRSRVLKTINSLVRHVSDSHGVRPREICNAVISGNTTMVHLLLGLKPEYIRIDPYTPTVLETPYLTAAEVGLEIHPQSWVYLSPCVGSYVGGDITAGILCTDLATDTEALILFIDIGTNGEIVVGNKDFMMTCACSAGPAFEGGGIGCGMRAAVGAVEKVEVDPAIGVAILETVGDVKPTGICGSGMISLLAELYLTGWLDSAGKLERVRPSPAIKVEGRRASYILAAAEESGTGSPLVITEADIENIIRAKAAIYSACELMMSRLGFTFDDLSEVYIAGGFGRFLDLDKATVIGLIPDLPRSKFRYIGNSSLTGSYMVLISQSFRERQIDIAHKMTYVEIGTEPSYMDKYTGALFLPHTNLDLFPTVKVRAGMSREIGQS